MSVTNASAGRRVLGFLGDELAALPDRVAALEEHVSSLAEGSNAGTSTVVALQDLDLLRQTLRDLSRLVATAEATTPDADLGALASAMSLHDLRARLLAERDAARPANATPGAFEAFRPATP